MGAVYKTADGVPCRACGGVLAPRSANSYGLCANCWNKALLSSGASWEKRHDDPATVKLSNTEITAWLTEKLVKDVRRLQRTGRVERCEVISNWAYGRMGTQCALPAVQLRDGHAVCNLHARATVPVYVTDERADGYGTLRGLLVEIATSDEHFAQVLADAARVIAPTPEPAKPEGEL